MTYSLVQRNHNSWTVTAQGTRTFEVVDTCGHKHRTLEGAVRCKNSLGSNALTHLGEIENAAGESVRSLDGGLALHEATQRVHEAR